MAADSSIIDLLQEASTNRTKIVAIADQIDAKLLEQNLAYRIQMPPEFVGVHPSNRNGYGLHDASVHALGSDIVSRGFSWQATAHACAIEDNSSGHIKSFSVKLAQNSDLLGKYTANVKLGSLSCSHTNAFLLAARQEIACDIENISEGGKMSMSKICRSDPGLQDAIKQGLKWLVYKSEVEQLYPAFPSLVQEARNQHLVREENEIQLLLRMHEMAQRESRSSDGAVDWGHLVKRVFAANALHDVNALASFVCRWSGGDDGQLLRELLDFHRSHVPSDRVIPSCTFQSLAALKLSADEHVPLFVIAVLKAQATCPPGKVQQKICRYITQGDIASIQGKRLTNVLAAEALLRKCRDLVRGLLVQPSSKVLVKMLGKLDTLIVRHVFEKSKDFINMDAIANQFIQDLQTSYDAQGHSVAIPNPWAMLGQSLSPSGDAAFVGSQVEPNFVQFDAAGLPKNANRIVLLQQGYHVGKHVMASDSQFKIHEIHDNGDVVVHDADGAPSTIEFDAFLTTFKAGKTAVSKLESWQSFDKCPAMAEHKKCAAMALGLVATFDQIGEAKIEVQTKPKGVFATQDYKKGALKLVCASSKIITLTGNAPAGSYAYQNVCVMPQLATEKNPTIIPAWYVCNTSDPDAANMELKFVKTETASTSGKSTSMISICVPILVNKKEIIADDELLLYNPAQPAPTKRRLGAVSIEHRSKQQRTS